jgi:hypothetical protein
MSTTPLPISLQYSLQEIVALSNVRGASICAILLSTTEGVPLGRVVSEQPHTPAQQQSQQQPQQQAQPIPTSINEDVLASIESVWAPASKQFPVLGLEKVNQVTAIYDHGSLIHIYQAPMVQYRTLHTKALVYYKKSKENYLIFVQFIVCVFFMKGYHYSLWSTFEPWCGPIDVDSITETCVRTIVTGVGQFVTTS